jgi:putative ABC transport system permease protein
MTRRAAPPRLAERLLAATVFDEAWRDSILGDLREEFAVTAQRRGTGSARRWYWSQAFLIGTRAVMARLGRRRSSGALLRSAEIETRAGWGAGLSRDFRHAWRTLGRRPGTSTVVTVTLAVALATNSTSYAILDALVLRPYRFAGVDRIVMVVTRHRQDSLVDREAVSPADFRDWRRESRTITQLSASEWWDASLSGIENPEQLAGFKVTAEFFDALGSPPVLGRAFLREEETPGNHRRVVLGHALWSRLFAADPGIVGRTIRVDGEPHEVVGVAPPGFAIPLGAQVWAPLAYASEEWNNRRSRYLSVYGRLAEGMSLGDAHAEIAAIVERLGREYPETNAAVDHSVAPFNIGMRDPGSGPFVATMQAASVLLLLIACANIANLLLARGGERSQEFAMRLALGASRRRLVWQLMIEAALLTAIAVVVAMPLAWVGLGLTRASIPAAIIRFVPGWDFMTVSPAVFWATAALGALATMVFALLPAWQTVRADVADTLRHGSRSTTAPRRRQWLRNTLAAAQVAITLALLFGSGLMLTAADGAVSGAFGFDRTNLLVSRVILPERPYADPERRRQFMTGVLDRLRTIPAVSAASMVSNLPYTGSNSFREFWLDGVTLQPGEMRYVDYRRATPEYFATIRIPLLAGRVFTEGDREGTTAVAVVSRSVATKYWNDEDPIGRQFRLARDGPPITVVGVVGDVLHDWFQQRRAPTVYRPLAQDAPFSHAFVVRTIGDPMNLAGDLRRAVNAHDPDLPLLTLQSMEDLIEERANGLIFLGRAVTVVAVIALLLAVMGLYSLTAFMVGRRTQELGVRIALGATRWQVIRMITWQGMRITAAGLIAGVAAAAALGRLMESALFGVVTSNAWQLAGLAALVAAVSLVASYIPARRTASLDPTIALRAE